MCSPCCTPVLQFPLMAECKGTVFIMMAPGNFMTEACRGTEGGWPVRIFFRQFGTHPGMNSSQKLVGSHTLGATEQESRIQVSQSDKGFLLRMIGAADLGEETFPACVEHETLFCLL